MHACLTTSQFTILIRAVINVSLPIQGNGWIAYFYRRQASAYQTVLTQSQSPQALRFKWISFHGKQIVRKY